MPVSPVIVIWSAIALVGVYFSYLNAHEALHDFRALDGRQNGRRRIAIDHLRREGSRLLVFGIAIVIGILAALDVEGPWVAILLIAILLTMVVNSVFDRRSRIYHMRYGIQGRDESGRFTRFPETQNQREDREFGTKRRELEQKHIDDEQ